MTKPLILHYAPDNASLCVRLLLEAMDMPFETQLVDRSAQGQKAPAYLALNPNGLIPTLVTPKGPMFETGAILLWLADQKPGTVFPTPDDPARARALTWLFWLSNTLHPCLRHIFYADQYSLDPKGVRAMAKANAPKLLDIAEANAEEITAHTALSCYLAPILRWLVLYGGRPGWLALDNWAQLQALTQTFEATPLAQRAALAEGLGPKPFSQPAPPNPPEGSAT